MKGFRFSKYSAPGQTPFDKLFNLFKELIVYTSGDVKEALDWLNELDRQYNLTDDKYTMKDFIEDLKQKGYLREEENNGTFALTSKAEQEIRKSALEEI